LQVKRMGVHSAGILLFRFRNSTLQVLLVHPGGPFWECRDKGAWSIPKGLIEANEIALDAAKREFREETGFEIEGEFIELGEIRQSGDKTVHAWALEMDIDETRIASNSFEMEWPKQSGKINEYPEIDKGAWFDLQQARKKIIAGQAGFIDRLVEKTGYVSGNKEAGGKE